MLVLRLATTPGTVAEVSSIARDEHTLSVTEHDVRRALMTASPACLNDYRPVALTSVVIKCFERLIKE